MIYVTGRRLSEGGFRPSHITDLRWEEPGTRNVNVISTRAEIVKFIDGGGVAKVRNPFGIDVNVHTVHPHNAPAYVQTAPDNTTADNLLKLPDC